MWNSRTTAAEMIAALQKLEPNQKIKCFLQYSHEPVDFGIVLEDGSIRRVERSNDGQTKE